MKMTTITHPNAKGQIVIPKKIRDSLGITSDSFLNLVLGENAFHVYPVEPTHSKSLNKAAYLKLLEKTRGRWGPATKEELEIEKKQREADLKAVAEAKKAW